MGGDHFSSADSGSDSNCDNDSDRVTRFHEKPKGGGGVGFGRGIILWENFVFKEGGEIFPWRSLGVSAVQCARGAVRVLGFARGAGFFLLPNLTRRSILRTKLSPLSPCTWSTARAPHSPVNPLCKF